jgi:uncharacterized protein
MRSPRRAVVRRLRLIVAISLIAVCGAPAGAQFPEPSGYVNDFAGLIAGPDEEYLETYLKNLERDTSAEVVLVTIASLDGATIEGYANRLFADWGIGKARSDNGALLLVASRDRSVRIEVGYGLEPILPDGLAGEIIRTVIVPEFSAGNYPRGIGRGLDRIAGIVRRDPSAMTSSAPPADRGTGAPAALFVIPFLAVFVAVGGFATGLGIRTKTVGPLLAGTLFAGVALLMAAATLSVFTLLVLLPVELVAVALGVRRGRSQYWIDMLRSGSPGGRQEADPSTWVTGGTESSSSDSGSSGVSDFGGGSSGGGGASGRW